MNKNPVNLAVRFLLEIVILVSFSCWGWHLHNTLLRYVCAIGLPVIAAILWGVFRIPNDPKPAPVAVPGIVRLLLEWILFGLAVWVLYDLGHPGIAKSIALINIIHYLISYDRTWAMLRNRPYNGFIAKQGALN